MRLPLIDGQGNFGSMDGDPPAAMRYTEARLAIRVASEALLEDIDREHGRLPGRITTRRTEEPTVLPARFPNLLVNGAGGIAVGMATNIPPHNLGEVIDACLRIDVDNRRKIRCRWADGDSCPARIFRPAGSSSAARGISRRPITPGAAPSSCGRASKVQVEEIRKGRHTPSSFTEDSLSSEQGKRMVEKHRRGRAGSKTDRGGQRPARTTNPIGKACAWS